MGTLAGLRHQSRGVSKADGAIVAYRIAKVLALAVGAVVTLFALMSLVGRLSPALWLHVAVGSLFGLALPLFLASRLLPEASARATAGLTTDVAALVWLAVSLVFVGPAFPWTQGMMATEASRLTSVQPPHLAAAAFWLAGEDPRRAWAPAPAPAAPAAPAPQSSSHLAAPAPAASNIDDGAPLEGDVSPSPAPAAARSVGSAELASPLASPDSVALESSEGAEGPALEPGQLVDWLAPAMVTLALRTRDELQSTTGFFIRDDGTLVTALHPLSEVVGIAARLHDGRWVTGAEVLAEDEGFDIALLRVRAAQPFSVVKLAEPKGSQAAWCAGDPVGLGLILREELVDGERDGENWHPLRLHSRACALAPGGPLSSDSGQVLGIVTDVNLLSSGPVGQSRPADPGVSGAPSPAIVALFHGMNRPIRRLRGIGDKDLW